MTPTPSQMRVLECIKQFRQTRGYSPTLQELADLCGRSKVSIHESVKRLQAHGLVRRTREFRSIELVSDDERCVAVVVRRLREDGFGELAEQVRRLLGEGVEA